MKILDTTLRDGSYSINFKFTAKDTAHIAYSLEQAGIELIEIGHGVGLGASAKGFGEASATDEEYIKATAETLTKAQFGVFCIPNIASFDDVRMLADNGASFIRIGVEASSLSIAQEYIELAKKLNLYVSVNFMKSYTVSPEVFAGYASDVASFGADILYLVDSAGGMLPKEIKDYYDAIKVKTPIELGFHGHNNIGMAIANSLCAIEYGASIVDSSLQGMGRSAGNASTEQLVAILQKQGQCQSINIIDLYDLGELAIRPLLTNVGISSLDIVCGISLFHSSYMEKVHKIALKYSVDPRILIARLCEVNKLDAPEGLLCELAKDIKDKTSEPITKRFHLDQYFGHEQG